MPKEYGTLQKKYKGSIETMYGKDDLSKCPLFAGGYINFGFWKDVNYNDSMSFEDRVLTQKALYDYVLNLLSINSHDSVLEVGSGCGKGCSLILEKYNPKKVVGIDISQEQIERSKNHNKELIKKFPDKISFCKGTAESLDFEEESFSSIVSIEALQHFNSVSNFIDSAYRVLRSNGKLGIATFFMKKKNSKKDLIKLIPTIRDNIDKVISIKTMTKLMEKKFHIHYEKIGQYVWEGFDAWISTTAMKDTWNRNWLKAYKKGFMDYYALFGKKKS